MWWVPGLPLNLAGGVKSEAFASGYVYLGNKTTALVLSVARDRMSRH